MRTTRFDTVRCGLLVLALSAQASLLVAGQDPQPAGPPWQISDGRPGQNLYMPREIRKAYENGTRSLDGRPGAKYWQNQASHKIHVTLFPPSRRVQAEQEIVYTNNSPTPLGVLLFRLYMNAHQPEAMREDVKGAQFLSSGIVVDEFRVDGVEKEWSDPASPLARVNVPGSTIHGIPLDKPLAPNGSVRINMRWHYDLAGDGGWKEGAIDKNTFFLAYFFPRITNYNDYSGWDTTPFTLGREFNNDFADFQVDVTTPRNYVVWATGELQNGAEVLQPAVQAALTASLTSDAVTTLAEAADVRAGRITADADTLTWKWRADHVSDFAFAVSNQYRWQASSVVVDPATGRRASVQAAYADSATDFVPMVETVRQALQFGSTKFPGVPYPYPKTTVVLGSADEEYPMMVNDGSNIGNEMVKGSGVSVDAFTAFVATHEILHSWFPFYMGINEKRYPFMDEGWTTAFEYLRNREVLGVPSADELFRFMRVTLVDWPAAASGADLPVITPYDSIYGQAPVFAFNQYGKAAAGYLALKELMGDAAFTRALHEFIARWHGKRPLPWDMFHTFNSVGAGNFNWFFENWFFGYNYMDLGLGVVRAEGGRVAVTVMNKGGMALPFDVVLTYDDGSVERVHRTPAVWQMDPRRTDLRLPAKKALKSVALETGIFVDFNPADNTWTAGSRPGTP